MLRRLTLALLAAATVAVVVAWAGTFLGVALSRQAPLDAAWQASAVHWFGFFLLFGLPIAFVVALALSGPRWVELQTQPVSRGSILRLTIVAGALVYAAVWLVLLGRLAFYLIPALAIGGLAGAAAGWTFDAIGLRSARASAGLAATNRAAAT